MLNVAFALNEQPTPVGNLIDRDKQLHARERIDQIDLVGVRAVT